MIKFFRCDNFEQEIEKYERKRDQNGAVTSHFNGYKKDDKVLQTLRERVKFLEIFKLEQTSNENDR